MRPTVFAGSVLTALGLSYPTIAATPAVGAPVRVEIYHRFIGPACAGICIDEDITVSSDGHVTWQPLAPARLGSYETSQREFASEASYPESVHNFSVPEKRAQKFIGIMRHARLSYDGTWKSNYCEWSIRFSDQSESDSHNTCAWDPKIFSLYQNAVDIIGMHNGFWSPRESFVHELSD